jgi:hypothetical protein
MKEFDLDNFLKINAVNLSGFYKKSDDVMVDFYEIEEILNLRKIKNRASFSNKIYLHILIKDSRLYSFLDPKSKIKNAFWVFLGKLLGYRI